MPKQVAEARIQHSGRKGLSLISANYALLAAQPGARAARNYLLQKADASTLVLRNVIRSQLRDAVRFRVQERDILAAPPAAPSGGNALQGPAVRCTTASAASARSCNRPGAEAPSAGHVV